MAEKDPGYSAFVQAVAGDGSSAPEVRMLTGWLGPSGEDGCVRLYLEASLSTCVDIPRDAILYSEEIPNSHPSGERTVWVKAGAALKEGGSAIARAAKFLSGSVERDYRGGAGPVSGVCLTYKPGCERTGIIGDCRSSLEPCGVGRPFTQIGCTAIGACNSAVCPQAAKLQSMTDVCPVTQSGHQCHTNCCRISDFVQPQPAPAAVSGPGWTCVCPPPQHTRHPGVCPTGGPCTGFAANFGWTAPNACPYHSYPACNTHVPCVTAPPCF